MIYWAIYQTLISGLILCPESMAQSASSRSRLLPFVYAVNFDVLPLPSILKLHGKTGKGKFPYFITHPSPDTFPDKKLTAG